jgi:Tir chaperone protein (CesT) family
MSPHHLVEEIGRRLGVALVPDDAGMARLMVDGTLAVDFELDDANDRVFVCGTIGILPAGPQREALFGDLLAANLFGADLGPCSPALDVERNELLLWFALDERDDIDGAVRALEDLVARLESWRGRLVGRVAPAMAATPSSSLSDAFLRA